MTSKMIALRILDTVIMHVQGARAGNGKSRDAPKGIAAVVRVCRKLLAVLLRVVLWRVALHAVVGLLGLLGTLLHLGFGVGVHRITGLHGILRGRRRGLSGSNGHASHEGRAASRDKQISHYFSLLLEQTPGRLETGVRKNENKRSGFPDALLKLRAKTVLFWISGVVFLTPHARRASKSRQGGFA
ncbi:hypothetical protein [Bradyrhizobium erythrophlei]|uniref:hypothetical protein n=1 Tax=Bradyrhizobium erythrophlei TaxID=1437360 RepID=UPI0012AB4649|nr:hypothetical protein [Bradyrhizobium erythrophlei]